MASQPGIEAVPSTAVPRASRSAAHARLLAFLVSVGLATVLGLASWLSPDSRGYGTHEQLGMPPCVTIGLFGLPCPLCGMTTSFALMAHGQPVQAIQTQPAGAIGFVVCIVLLVTALACQLQPRWFSHVFEGRFADRLFKMGLWVVLLGWIYKVTTHLLT